MSGNRVTAMVFAIVMVMSVIAGTAAFGAGSAAAAPPDAFEKDTVMSGLNQPTAMTFLPDGRALILQKGGEILIANPDTGTSETYMTVSDLDTGGEEGLIDITLDPEFEQNNHFYLYYTPSSSSKNRIARFTHQENAGGLSSSADTSSEFVVWEDSDDRKSDFHHGGGLDFGPDGTLYLTIGEEVDPSQAQDLTQAGGSVIRVNKNGTVPTDNPFVDGPGGNVDAIWAYGLRNPFRATWDLQADDPRYYIAEVGGNNQDTAQEDLHLGEAGANYGWPDCEGVCDDPDYTDAFYTYPHEGSGASITGGFVYHGDQFPSEYEGAYFFGDYVRGWMKYMTFDSSGEIQTVEMFDENVGSVVEIDEGPDGSLFFLDIATGTLQQISYDATADESPTLDPIGPTFVEEGETTQISITATDPNDDPLTLSAANLPDFATFTDNGDGTGTVTLAPQAGDAGQYQGTITASDGTHTDSETVDISVLEPGSAAVAYRVHAGPGTISAIDNGPDWESDAAYMQTPGDTSDWSDTTYTLDESVPPSTPDPVFETERWPSSGDTIEYDFPVTPGEEYEVRLYFIEQYDQTQNPGDRIFDVTAEGETILDDYDTVDTVGYKTGTMENFTLTASDDTLDLAFAQDGGNANPFMYGIEILQSPPDNEPPSASFSYSPSTPTVGETVTFDAAAATDSDGSIQSYEWDFDGDGTIDATGQTASHAFASAGDQPVELTVTDDDGATATATQTVDVSSAQQGQQVLYRVNGGGPTVAAGDAPDWESDNGTSPSQYLVGDGGTTEWPTFTDDPPLEYDVGSAVPAGTPDTIFEYERYAPDGDLEWAFPVTQGETYEVRLYHIEQYSDAQDPGDRVMDVSIEGQTVLDDYDIVADVGYKNATMESFEVTADDGTLDISIAQDGGDHNPNVFGIEIIEPASNQPPTATIDTPADGSTFQAGDTIDFSGTATDPDEGTLAGAQLEWRVRFLHNEHWHPYLDSVSGTSGSFTVPTSGHGFQDDTAYEIALTATDAQGATDTASVVVEPEKVDLTVDTQPSGLDVRIDSIPYTTPHVHDTLIGFEHTVEAPQTQCLDGTEYAFDGWSDGGAAEHTITVPSTNTTVTATYTDVGPCDGTTDTIAEAVASQNAPTDVIGLQEIQLAINWWATGTPVPDTDGATISIQEMQQLINLWATGETVGDGDQNQAPSAAFAVTPASPEPGEPVTFDASASSDPDGTIASYSWDFDGDGTEDATGSQVTHTFDSAGTYQVTLTVTDDDEATATATQQVPVSESEPQQVVHRLNAGDDQIAAVDDGPDWESDAQYLLADGQQSGPETWGENYSVGSAVPTTTPDLIFESERWTDAGPIEYELPVAADETYQVRLYFIEQWSDAETPGDRIFDVAIEDQTVLDDYDVVADVGFKNATMESFEITPADDTLDVSFTQDGGTAKPFVYGIEVLTADGQPVNQQPSAAFSHTPDTPTAGEPVSFDASGSSDPDGTIASYNWTFGDGAAGTGQSPDHVYSQAGTYDVTLTVTDDEGAQATATQTITVEQAVEQVVYRVNTGGPAVAATDGGPDWAVDNSSEQSPYLIGDGDLTVHDEQFTVTDSVPPDTPEQLFVTERYVDQQMSWEFPVTAGGSYEVRLYYIEQWEPNAQVGTRIFDVSIEGTTVQNDYDVMADVGFDNATMESFDVTAQDGTLDIDFEQDGGSAYPLIYGIEIIQQGGGGGNIAPSASFSASTTAADPGQSISFDASGSNDPDGSIASYAWDFDGDGADDASGSQTSHAFDDAGTYEVELTVTDDQGATDTATETITISESSAGSFVNEQMASGLDSPVAMEVLPDGRMLVIERGGDMLIAQEAGGSLSTSEYFSLQNVNTDGERGLLDLTIDPNFEQNGYVYFYYSNSTSGTNQVSRVVHQENGGGLASTADPGSETRIWQSSIDDGGVFHHGAGLDIGPDGTLYFTTGEQGTASNAQDLSSTGGKVIRINTDGSIPSDNPFVDGPGGNADSVWALGLRNPFRATWDAETDRFLIAEVGQSGSEDVHVGQAGANYGWPDCEGMCDDPAYTDPIYTYPTEGGASITGGDVYRGDQFPSEYEGAYFYGDYVRGWIKYLTFDNEGNVTGSHDFEANAGAVVEIDQGPDGSLYYIDITGSIHRITFEPAEEGSTALSLNEGNSDIDASTWETGAVEIENTGEKPIDSVSFDLSTAAMPDIVFGPLTDSGTPGNAVKDASGVGGFDTSYSQPHDGNSDDGYDVLTFTFDDFQPGETFTVSLDTDATSVKGATPIQQGLEISGLETTGTTVTVEYADGTSQSTTPFSDGSAAGAVGTAAGDVPPAPSLEIQDVPLDDSILDARHSGATVTAAAQTVEVTGPPGETVRVLRFEGELDLEDVSGYDLEPYEANRLLNFDEQTVTLDNSGQATVGVTLANTSDQGGLNYLVATVEDDQGDTGFTSEPIVLEYAPDAQVSGGEATLAITTTEAAFPDGMITLQDATTYFEDSVLITNTGDEPIESLTIDKSTALIENMVFDPTGCAGDGGCNPGSTDLRIVNDGGAGMTSHQFLDPVNGIDGTDGYRALQFEFDDFDPGETFSYASDGDPNTIKGAGGQQSVLAGPESGIDLTGTTVTASFADGTTSSAGTFNEGSLAGSTGVARASAPGAPSVDAPNVSLQQTTFSDRHAAATVADDQQTIEVSGPPGATVRLMHAEATLLLEDVPDHDGTPGYQVEPYEANNVENYTIADIELGPDGTETVDVTLTNLTEELTSPDDRSGFNYFVAVVQGEDGHAGMASNVVVLKLDETSNVPAIQSVDNQFLDEGESTTVSVEASDPNGDPLTLSASNLPAFASFTDNGDGTGTLSLAPQSGDAGTYDVTLSASDGEFTATESVTISVAEPGAEQVIYRLNAGESAVDAIDGGQDWESDSAYLQVSGDQSDWSGETYTIGEAVPATTPDAIFESERYPSGGNTLDYELPVTQGETYELRLYFIEQYSQTQNPGDRIFDVAIEDQIVLDDYDVVADVGYKNATMESFEVTADDGTLDVSLSQVSGANPLLYGMEVVAPGAGSNQVPSASFTASATEVEVDQSVEFDASASSDPDGSIASYSWDFDGDGTEDASGAQVNYTFDSADTYQVDLTVTDDDGATDTAQQSITVNDSTTSNVVYRVNTGGSEITIADEPDWETDENYLLSEGDVTIHDEQFAVTESVPAGTPDDIFVTERWPSAGTTLDYELPVTQGESYEVRLYFIEQWDPYAEEGTRILDVSIESQTVLDDYDIMADVGFDNATMESFEVTADDDTLDISIAQDGGSASPFVYGIEIIDSGGE